MPLDDNAEQWEELEKPAQLLKFPENRLAADRCFPPPWIHQVFVDSATGVVVDLQCRAEV